jgi:hypothetical protein
MTYIDIARTLLILRGCSFQPLSRQWILSVFRKPPRPLVHIAQLNWIRFEFTANQPRSRL